MNTESFVYFESCAITLRCNVEGPSIQKTWSCRFKNSENNNNNNDNIVLVVIIAIIPKYYNLNGLQTRDRSQFRV